MKQLDEELATLQGQLDLAKRKNADVEQARFPPPGHAKPWLGIAGFRVVYGLGLGCSRFQSMVSVDLPASTKA